MAKIIKPEVLAPAGDLERLQAAVEYGADAVYLGSKMFGMRAGPANFDMQQLKSAVEYAHSRQVQVYLTCNTLPTNAEVAHLEPFLRDARDAGIDSIIVADIGILMAAKRVTPDLPVHISTQAGIVNYLTANELYRLGASRVVLARELSLGDIRVIRDNTPPELEIEAFVHGAMCMSFSGRCLLSNYLVQRDANRGECAQPCRWGYHLMEEKRPGQYFPIYEDEKGSYILNAKDLCMIEHVDKLVEAGITSLKIEGRAKSAYYVAVATNAYRCAVDEYVKSPENFQLPQWLFDEVRKLSHREYSTGFFFGKPKDGQYYKDAGYVRTWDIIAVVDDFADGWLTVTERNRFLLGDEVEVLEPGKPPVPMKIEQIIDISGEAVEAACHPMRQYKIPCSTGFAAGSIVRKCR